jgi:hypothetical protein
MDYLECMEEKTLVTLVVTLITLLTSAILAEENW